MFILCNLPLHIACIKAQRSESGVDQVKIISVFVLLFALFLPALAHMLRAYPRWFAATKYVILGVYILANLYETILFRSVKPDYKAEWELLWSYRKSLSLPDGMMSLLQGTVAVEYPKLLEEIILNILLYIPLGYLLPFIFTRLKPWQVILIAFVCSALTEISQLVFKIGMFEFDDMLNNTMGCAIGLLMYMCIVKRWGRTNHSTP